jgi:hypothetical protein
MREFPTINLFDERLTTATIDETEWSFGWGGLSSSNGNKTAIVYAGRVRAGARAYVDVAQTEVVLSNDPEFLCVRYCWADNTAAVVAVGSTEPIPNEQYYYQTYYKVEQVSGGSYIESTPYRFARGDLVIPGAFGDG